jgi:hypothetical protein
MAGHRPRAAATATAASTPGSRTSTSNANPGEGSASRASPTGVSGESKKARAIPPIAAAAATTSVVAMPKATSWRRDVPSALSVVYDSASMAA